LPCRETRQFGASAITIISSDGDDKLLNRSFFLGKLKSPDLIKIVAFLMIKPMLDSFNP